MRTKSLTAALVAFVVALSPLLAAGAASAMPAPPPDDYTGRGPAPETVVIHHGAPLWAFVAVAVAILTLAITAAVSWRRGVTGSHISATA